MTSQGFCDVCAQLTSPSATRLWHSQHELRCMPCQRWPLLWSRETWCKPSSTRQSPLEQLCSCLLSTEAQTQVQAVAATLNCQQGNQSPLPDALQQPASIRLQTCFQTHTVRQLLPASLMYSSQSDMQMMPADALHLPAKVALPIQRLSPFSSHPPGTRLAVVCRAEASLPLLGSVRPQAPTVFSAARSGSSSCRQGLSVAPCL